MQPHDGHNVEYPILGEPPVVEFANTLYTDTTGVFDFLSTVSLARGWFAALEPSALSGAACVSEEDRGRLVELRTAIRVLTDTGDRTDVASSLAVLERTVNAAPGRVALTADDAGLVTVATTWDLADPVAAAACLAHAAIDVVAGRAAGPIRTCDRPACNMRYLQQHRRRRYCNPACANSDRQTRFQQRQKN